MIKNHKKLFISRTEEKESSKRLIKFVQIMILNWSLTVLEKGQIGIPVHSYWQNIEKTIFREPLKGGPIIFDTNAL